MDSPSTSKRQPYHENGNLSKKQRTTNCQQDIYKDIKKHLIENGYQYLIVNNKYYNNVKRMIQQYCKDDHVYFYVKQSDFDNFCDDLPSKMSEDTSTLIWVIDIHNVFIKFMFSANEEATNEVTDTLLHIEKKLKATTRNYVLLSITEAVVPFGRKLLKFDVEKWKIESEVISTLPTPFRQILQRRSSLVASSEIPDNTLKITFKNVHPSDQIDVYDVNLVASSYLNVASIPSNCFPTILYLLEECGLCTCIQIEDLLHVQFQEKKQMSIFKSLYMSTFGTPVKDSNNDKAIINHKTMEKILSIMERDGIQSEDLTYASDILFAAYDFENIGYEELASKLKFSDGLLRTAYIYTYFTAHVYGTRDLWHKFSEFNEVEALIGKPNIKICSIGGGPGTDVIGTSFFLKSKNFKGTIQGSVLEYYLKWEVDAHQLLEKFKAEDQSNITNIDYYKFDFLQQHIDDISRQEIERADVVTLIKFISAMTFHDECLEKIGVLVGYMKQNALLFITDNSGGTDYYELFTVLTEAGFIQLEIPNTKIFPEFETSVPYQEKEVMHNHDPSKLNVKCNPYKTVHPNESLNNFVTVWVLRNKKIAMQTTTFEKVLTTIQQFQHAAIERECEIHSTAYRPENQPNEEASRLDYSDPVTRLAYIFTYFTSHTLITQTLWNKFTTIPEILDLIGKPVIKICSIGGGPGTDIIATNLFLRSNGFQGKIEGIIFDRYPQWKDIVTSLIDIYRSENKSSISSINVHQLDFTQFAIDAATTERIKSANVVTIVKFISAVTFAKDRFKNLESLISCMNKNSILFIEDNSGDSDNGQSKLREMLNNAKFRKLCWIPHITEEIPVPEAQVMQNHNPYRRRPQQTLSVFVTIWIKK